MPLRVLACLIAWACVLAWAGVARAAEETAPIVIWPTVTPAGDDASPIPLHKPKDSEQDLGLRAQVLDVTLHDAVEDLGYSLDVADPGPTPGHLRDEDLIERAARSGSRGNLDTGTWVVSPRIEKLTGGNYLVRIVTVPP